METVALTIGKAITNCPMDVDKSIVSIGTARKVAEWVNEELKARNEVFELDVVSNP